MGLSDRMAKTAQRLIDKYGASSILTRQAAGVYDPATQTETPGRVISDEINAVVTDYKAHEVDGENIRYGDKKFLVSELSLENLIKPQSGDILTNFGQKYRVVDVSGLTAGDGIPAYEIQVRR